MPDQHMDVIIIGGRCAGASLALRLSGHNLKILLVDRASFPSAPDVPSAPFIHPATMRLLDEIGIHESDFQKAGHKIDHFVIEMVNHFQAIMPIAQVNLDRSYFYGIDRNRFDRILWQKAVDQPDIITRSGFSVTDILKNEQSQPYGIVGTSENNEKETYTADLIIGADGRYSFSAQKLDAPIIEERNDYTSAVYVAEWENVDDYSADYPHAVSTYNTGRGLMILAIPVNNGKYHIGTYMKSDDAKVGANQHQQLYLNQIQSIPNLWNRLQNAKRVTDVVGIRPIKNGYRQAWGDRWALVGDAVHYKDPADGQGIYDTLIGSKLLANAIFDWRQNGTSWHTAGENYQQGLSDATHAMFEQTVKNVKQTLYSNAPAFILKSLVRWMMTDPHFQRDFLRYLSRDIRPEEYKPERYMSPALIMNGVLSDIRNRF